MSISIREHCIPSYDEISRMESVAEKLGLDLPQEFQLEQKTAAGIIKKLHSIVESKWFKQLPETVIIKSGFNEHYIWKKHRVVSKEQEIWNECKHSIN